MIASLEGIRVVDITTNVAGPFASQILGDLGAEVIKIERPGTGDDTRSWGPPFYDEQQTQSVTFASLNRNKRSICLNLKHTGDKQVLNRLIEGADVLLQNLRAGSFERLGYSWKWLHEMNPRLVYLELTGFGHLGPMAGSPAFDPLMQAFSGLMSLVGEEGRPPVRVPVSILDKGTGMWAAIGILNALLARASTGEGAHVRTSLLETALMWQPGHLMSYLATTKVPGRHGSGIPGIAPYQVFEASDGFLMVAAGNQRLWETLCETIGRRDLLDDPRFIDNPTRSENRGELAAELTSTFRTRTVSDWVDVLTERGVPASPIHDVAQAAEHPQVEAIGMIEHVEHPDTDRFALVNLPMWVNDDRMPHMHPPPQLGEDTRAILTELGLANDEADALCTRNGVP